MKRLLNPTPSPICKRLVIYFVSFIFFYFINIAFDIACGPEPDPYDYYITFFHNNIHKSDGYKSFYFNGYTFLNGNVYEAEEDNKIAEGDINVKEWVTYCGAKATYKDIAHVLYELDRTTDSLYFRGYKKGKTIMPDSLKNNSFVKYLLRSQKKMSYLVLAKKSELLVNPSSDDQWNAMRSDKDKKHEFALKYIQMGLAPNSNFFRLRCFYQAQRLLHYGGYFKEASDVYDKYIITMHSRSHVMGWALSLKAGEEEHLDHKASAAYLFSKLFAGYPERRVQAYYAFLTTKIPVESVINLAKNNNEKATIYAIKGIHNAHIGVAALQQVYKTYPKSEFVSILLIREINKIEEGYLTPKINGDEYYGNIGYYDHTKYDSVKHIFINYIPQLKALCMRLATEGKYPEPALFYLASAYLSWIQKAPNSGLSALAHINNKNLRTKLSDQKQLINLLLLSQKVKQLNRTTEAKLLPSLLWLDKMVKKESFLKFGVNNYNVYDFKLYSASARDFYAKVLTPIYLKQKDTTMAALCILKSERTIPLISRYGYAPRLAFDLPNFWRNQVHSFQLEKILKWNSSAQKTAYLDLLMKTINQPTTVIISGDKPFKGGGYEYMETRHSLKTIIPALYDLLGTTYLREHKYVAAIKAFHHLNAKELENSTSLQIDYEPFKIYNSYPIPFIDQLRDYPKVYSNKKRKGYSKLAFAEAMAALQHKIKTSSKQQVATYYYQMALGLYNTSYYGSAWIYAAYQQADSDKYRTKGPYYDRDYLKNHTAEAYFLKARALSNDNELKAKCTFMAAKCAQSQINVPNEYEDYLIGRRFDLNKSTKKTLAYDKALRNSSYFYELKEHYQKTKFYRIAIRECSYFRDFITGYLPKKEPIKRVIVINK